MRRISRLQRSIDRLGHSPSLRPSASSYLCANCEVRATSFSTTSHAHADTPFSEKIRQRIWGTDQPPGLKDPYGGASVIDQAISKKKAREAPVREEQATPVDSTYQPAESWEGLEVVGGKQEPQHQFRAWVPEEKIVDTYELTAALHRAVVETLALKQTGAPLAKLAKAGVDEDVTAEIQIVATPEGVKLDFSDSQASLEDVVNSLQPLKKRREAVAAEPQEFDANDEASMEALLDAEKDLDVVEAQRTIATWDPAWLKISLQDPELKFTILKRVTQLTGQRVKDSAIHAIKTVQQVLNQIIVPPKPQKLAEILLQRAELVSLPNVRIVDRRITPIDKEQSVGRWKVIEKELIQRGLPVTGHDE